MKVNINRKNNKYRPVVKPFVEMIPNLRIVYVKLSIKRVIREAIIETGIRLPNIKNIFEWVLFLSK